MSNYSEQESGNELKLIGKVEVKIKPKGLDNNSKSIDQLSNAIAEEKSRLDELIVKVDANYERLVKNLRDLKEQVNNLTPEEAPTHINAAGEHELL